MTTEKGAAAHLKVDRLSGITMFAAVFAAQV